MIKTFSITDAVCPNPKCPSHKNPTEEVPFEAELLKDVYTCSICSHTGTREDFYPNISRKVPIPPKKKAN